MQVVHDKAEVSIGEYVAVLRRRWIWAVGTVIVLVGLVLARDLRQAPVYRSSVQMLLQSKASENIFVPNVQAPDSSRAVQNELRVINSRLVRAAAAEAFGAPISVEAIAGGDDDVIILRATDTNPDRAARKANVYAEAYQGARLSALVEDLSAARSVIQTQIDDFQEQIDVVNQPLALIDEAIVNTEVDDPRLASLQAQRDAEEARTSARRQELEDQLSEYQQRLQLLQLSERLTTTGGVQILNPAQVPSTPVSPTIVRDVIQTFLIAAFLGVGLAFLRDQLDDSVRTQADLERLSRSSISTIGLIPVDASWRSPSRPQLTTLDEPASAVAEAYRALRTSLQYLALDRPMKVVMVTSANAGEGKTSTLANLAVAYARAGKRVAVVGADLRRPRIHRFFDVDGQLGMTNVLLGDIDLADAVQHSPVSSVDVLASGPTPPNPSELLSLDRTQSLLRRLAEEYSIVFIDTPPVLPVTDALVLSRCVDATIFLASAQRTSKREAKRALDMLQQIDSPLIGLVLNGVGEEAYGSLYQYYGTSEPGFFRRIFRRDRPEPVSDLLLPDEIIEQEPPTADEPSSASRR